MAAAFVYDRIKSDTDPLSAENPIIMATGPFTGTPIPMVSRYAIGGISPLTGFWGEATSGGAFPFRLKGSGWDGIIVSGKSDRPVYLHLGDGQAEIRDARNIWGKDSYETQTLIKQELQDDKISVAGIGPAGEKLIKYACVMNDKGRAAGRCGFGALMGSKNLKAIAAAGNRRADLADAGKVAELAKQAVKDINGNLVSVAFREYGTLMYMDMGMILPTDRLISEGKGEPAAKFQSFKDLFDSLTLCKFAPLQVPGKGGILNPANSSLLEEDTITFILVIAGG
jgi:aldehyde:ferredoxin oxidoreductase